MTVWLVALPPNQIMSVTFISHRAWPRPPRSQFLDLCRRIWQNHHWCWSDFCCICLRVTALIPPPPVTKHVFLLACVSAYSKKKKLQAAGARVWYFPCCSLLHQWKMEPKWGWCSAAAVCNSSLFSLRMFCSTSSAHCVLCKCEVRSHTSLSNFVNVKIKGITLQMLQG